MRSLVGRATRVEGAGEGAVCQPRTVARLARIRVQVSMLESIASSSNSIGDTRVDVPGSRTTTSLVRLGTLASMSPASRFGRQLSQNLLDIDLVITVRPWTS